MKQIRKRLTYANVMSTMAVFLLVGGGAAFAATKLPKNSVGGKQLKNNSVTSPKVKDHSLLAADFKAGQIPAGPQGPQGPAGSDAFGELVYKVGAEVEILANEQAGVSVDCDPGYHVVGGGVASSAGVTGEDVNSSYPSKRGDPEEYGSDGWAGFVDNKTAGPQFAQALAICAKAGKVTGP